MTTGHVTDHNTMRNDVLAESARLGLPVDIGGPFNIGDAAHISEHNKLVAAIQALADTAGVTVTLPDTALLNDAGHITDHALLLTAIDVVQTAPGWNAATGGTVTDFTYSGSPWRQHVFTSSGTFTATENNHDFRITIIAKGGSSGYSDAPESGGGAGGGGGGYVITTTLATGATAITVDGTGGDATVAGVGHCGGGGQGERESNHDGPYAGRTGTWGGTSTGGAGSVVEAIPNDPSAAFRTLLDGTTGTWGKYGAEVPSFAGGSSPGTSGIVVIEYQTGA